MSNAQIADAARVLEWMRNPNRNPAQLAFTDGPERQAAYWIEIAQAEPSSEIAGLKTYAATIAAERDAANAEIERLAEQSIAFGAEMFAFQERFGLDTALNEQISAVWDAKYCLRSERDALAKELAEITQAITDSENQPSQFGTVTLEYMEKEIDAIKSKHALTNDENGFGPGES